MGDGQVCYYNVPVTEFATDLDLRYAARVVNQAACTDPRDGYRIWSKVAANAVTPSCWVLLPCRRCLGRF